jgi:hypothetical protein
MGAPGGVKLSWSIASLTRGFSGLSGNTPHGDHPVTNGPGQSDQDEKRSLKTHEISRIGVSNSFKRPHR